MLKKYLLPDYLFDNVFEITPQFICGLGARAVILDIDNTLVTYDDLEPTPEVAAWLAALGEAGLKLAFVSNNSQSRVERFCRGMDVFWSADSGKPSRRAFSRAAEVMGVDANECVAIGDQLFTDVLGAKRLGMRAIVVRPIKDKLTPLFIIKRAGEKIIYALYGIKF
ncbi:MAG TPA: YqeG family HAD IIIA-type phosphatase [Bacillota bacterium]|nr:YqeG family HAD IIIA-type phosphatase [Clostridiales bacterium]HPT85564.1 YqeG family HAD IIIA-type phosphatase [Bacillota bacterium]